MTFLRVVKKKWAQPHAGISKERARAENAKSL
jgi:hypothetical protein